MKTSSVSFLLLGLLLLNACTAFGERTQSRSQQQEKEQQGHQQQGHPYVFQNQHYSERFQTEHGRIRELPRFTQRSELLRGIDNFRFAVLEADPNTFIVPNHLDAELVVFVGQGNGAISYVLEDRTETIDIQRGDILRVPAGITHFFVNKDNNRKLILVKLLQPVSNPGQYEPFFGAGGENPQSFYRAFSNEVLEAVFQSRNPEEIKRIFRQRQGVIVKASQQQIQELSQHHGSRPWPFHRGQQAQEKVNIFEKQPVQQNQFGKLYEVSGNDFQPLREINVAVSFANITQGGMTAPVYNSKAWKLAFVLSQDGYFEAACPHLSQQHQQQGQGQQQPGHREQGQGQQQQGQGQQQTGHREQGQGQQQPGQGQQQTGQREQGQGQGQQQYPGQGRQQQQGQGGPVYERVSSPLRQATLVVVPPGHPAVFVASNNNNLEVVCFDINASGNQKVPLAGRGNVYNQLERVAMDLSFGAPGREVEELFNRNKEQFFFRGPQQQQQQQGSGRADE